MYHIPKVLYHWRQHPISVSINPESKPLAVKAGQSALQDTLERRNIQGEVEKLDSLGFYRVRRRILNQSLISIIIPFKDKSQLLRTCIEAILKKTSFQNYEIICINNNSIDQETYEVIIKLRKADNRLRFVDYNIPFNFSKINNYGISLSNGEHIVLMNNDIEIISTDWIDALLEHSQREEVGVVGGKLYYPDDTIQHAGVIVGIGGNAGHAHKHFKRNARGYSDRLRCIQNVSAVTGALLMVEKILFKKIGGLDEEKFTIALNDIDFCLKLRSQGYLNIFTPYCEAYHHESASRGYENTPEKKARFEIETSHFRKKWKDILENGDPYYNPNLTLEKEDFSLRA
jgi:GT2 family glycosyltransferase